MDSPPPTECACGLQNFERVVAKRLDAKPYRTEFIACAECRVMYYAPETRAPESNEWNKAQWLRTGDSTPPKQPPSTWRNAGDRGVPQQPSLSEPNQKMCYSAQVEADYRTYVRMYGAHISIKEFIELFWARAKGAKVKIPKRRGKSALRRRSS